MARRKARPSIPQDADPEALALRIHQIAAVVGMLARGQEQNADPLSHALYLVEADLLDVETRVEGLRFQVANAQP